MHEETFDELALMRRSAFDTNGERKTVIIGESDDFRPLAALSGPTARARQIFSRFFNLLLCRRRFVACW
jgi:hypothetical protein